MFLRAALGMTVALTFVSQGFGQCLEEVGYKACVWAGPAIVPCPQDPPHCTGVYKEWAFDDTSLGLEDTPANEGNMPDFIWEVACSLVADCTEIVVEGQPACGPVLSTRRDGDKFLAGWVNWDLPCL